MRIVDNIIALRIIHLLITPFKATDAYKLGLIDEKGNTIKKAKTAEEKNSTSMLHRLVWNIKKMIELVPGGSTKIGTLAAAMLLVKEALEKDWSENRLIEEYYDRKELYEQIRFLEEEDIAKECIQEIQKMIEDAPVNATGGISGQGDNSSLGPLVKRIKKKLKRPVPGGERHISDFL